MPAKSVQSTYGDKIYEGKAKILYRGPKDTILHYFKDSATAFNAQKKAEFDGKGQMNLKISVLLFDYLKMHGIESHLIKQIDDRTFESLSLKMIPAEVVVRNRVAGSLAKRLGEDEGAILNPPTVEFYLKDDAKGDPLVSEDLMVSLFHQKREDLLRMRELALKINSALLVLFQKAKLNLIDFKLEFGKTPGGKILLADEISPDCCRLWDMATGEKLDKDRFRHDLGDLMTGYQIVYDRLIEALK
ncbi:MAG: phosphoribosylaminoimidazole-succinocarboxamide synthase [Bacteriovoracaceae bacterium]|nr:phosphoribosylaminoimidazole-succinocarboxamide synthase [Bacteriovoracaceae bacterium]